ncbi:hypothetical protein AO372_0173 [Moraxella catarrhalis]|nr:hypothetical protein AO379_1831 [Moraxella catarrhalis]OAV15703.1 hypothetical protein AO375_0661 [Moraxella catarrhalis]OAV22621.1 hypothetical protein AO372_0173 [Moraxella catarrhalis]OAV25953.1 hypothetical protein AO369_1243 [Moraxella catarrhalis]OAV36813.1 hypothetical protein AO365_0575 [Moraxella catarrhalis]
MNLWSTRLINDAWMRLNFTLNKYLNLAYNRRIIQALFPK